MSDVSGRRSPDKRARDADRDEICRVLDVALAEGQLTGEEHRQRVAAATSATTLGELDGLTTDLQSGTPSGPSEAPRPDGASRRVWFIAVGVAGLLAVVVTGVLVATNSPDAPPRQAAPTAHPVAESPIAPIVPTSPATGPDGVEPSVVSMPQEFHTVDGMTALLDTIRQRFGDTTGIELAIWREDAMLLLPNPTNDEEKDLYRFNDGWGTPSTRERDPEDVPADLGAFDVPAVVAALRDAPATVGIPAEDVSDLVVDIDHVQDPAGQGGLELMVKVSNSSGADGFIYLDSAGHIKSVEQSS